MGVFQDIGNAGDSPRAPGAGETFAIRIAALVLRLARARFYGRLEVTFEDGVVQHAVKSERLKPERLSASDERP